MATNLLDTFKGHFLEYCSLSGIKEEKASYIFGCFEKLDVFNQCIDGDSPLIVPGLNNKDNEMLNLYFWNYIIDLQLTQMLAIEENGVRMRFDDYVDNQLAIFLKLKKKDICNFVHTRKRVNCKMIYPAGFAAVKPELCERVWNLGRKDLAEQTVLMLNRPYLKKINRMSKPIAYVMCFIYLRASNSITTSYIDGSNNITLCTPECEKHGYTDVIEHEGVHMLCAHIKRTPNSVEARRVFEQIARDYKTKGFYTPLKNELLKSALRKEQ
jgi:hypothetical protein